MIKFVLLIALLAIYIQAKCENGVCNQRFQSVSPEKAILLQKGNDKQSCSRCGMNLIMFYKTSHAAKVGNNVYQYCSIHCMAEHQNSGAKLSDKKVVDVLTLKFIDVDKANYVVGSEIQGTMSNISKYVFNHEKNAKIFQSKFGGKIMGFKEALEVTQKDFK